MSENDYKRIIDKMDEYIENIPLKSPNESLRFLINAGKCTEKGAVSKIYKKR